MDISDRYPLAQALEATAARIVDACQRPQALPPVVLTVAATRPAADTEALMSACVTLAADVHPGLRAAWTTVGLTPSGTTRYVTADPSKVAAALAWVAPGCIRVGTAESNVTVRDPAMLDELTGRRCAIRPARRAGMARTGYITVSKTARTFTLDVVADRIPAGVPARIGHGVTLGVFDARQVLAAVAADIVVVDTSSGTYPALCKLARRAVIAREHPGAPALAELAAPGTDRAVVSAAAALERLAHHDGKNPIGCSPAVADAAAVETASPSAQRSLRPVQAAFAGAYAASPVGLACVLAPGTGKTVAAAGALAARRDAHRILVAAPASVLHQWTAELAAHHPVAHVTVASDARTLLSALGKPAEAAHPSVVIASHDTVAHAAPDAVAVDDLVIDEGEFLRNDSKRTTAMWVWRRRARRAMVLTATPVKRSRLDIGCLVGFVFADRAMFDGWPLDAAGLSPAERLGRFCFGLADRADADLPEVARRVLWCRPGDVEAQRIAAANQAANDAHARYAVALADPAASARQRAKARLAAHQAWQSARAAGCDPVSSSVPAGDGQRGGAVRRSALTQLVADGVTTLVFCDSAVLARDLAAWLAARGVRAGSLTGAQTAAQRAAIAAKLGTDLDVVVCAQVGRLGLNLQAASRVVHFDTPASAGEATQREGRARRLGGTAVDVVFLTTVGAVDAETACALAARTDSADPTS